MGGDMIATLRRVAAPLHRRIHLMIGRAVLTALSDAAGRQRVQFGALKGETKDGVERVQEYGITSCPLPGAQVRGIKGEGGATASRCLRQNHR